MFTTRISKTFIILLVLAVAIITASFVSRSATTPTADRSYDGIELVRALPDSPSGYEQIEAVRVQRSVSQFTADSSYGLVEQVRLERTRNADHSYDQIEALRLAR
jgi:hypothetical protein